MYFCLLALQSLFGLDGKFAAPFLIARYTQFRSAEGIPASIFIVAGTQAKGQFAFTQVAQVQAIRPL